MRRSRCCATSSPVYTLDIPFACKRGSRVHSFSEHVKLYLTTPQGRLIAVLRQTQVHTTWREDLKPLLKLMLLFCFFLSPAILSTLARLRSNLPAHKRRRRRRASSGSKSKFAWRLGMKILARCRTAERTVCLHHTTSSHLM